MQSEIMTDPAEENVFSNDCTEEDYKAEYVKGDSESYEEITIIVTGTEPDSVLAEGPSAERPDLKSWRSENDTSEEDKREHDAHRSNLEGKDHLQAHLRRRSRKPKLASTESDEDEDAYVGSFCKVEVLEKYFGRHHTRLLEDKNPRSRLSNDEDTAEPLNCDKCSYVARSKFHLSRHLRIHVNGKQFKCDACEFATAYKGALQRHAAQTHGSREKKHSCGLCSFRTHRKGNLEVHVRTHTNSKPFRCSLCEYASSQKGTLKQHMLYKHSEKGETYSCDVCPYTARIKQSLTMHMRIHSGERRPHKCAVCEYETADRGDLNRHTVRTHVDEARRYKCANCTYSTYERRLLVAHMSVHSNEKPFGCEICKFRSASKSSLRTHVLVRHSGDSKRYKCEYCGYSTHIGGHLVRHVRIHTNEKPYRCEICGFASAQSGNLKQHVLVRHDGEIKV